MAVIRSRFCARGATALALAALAAGCAQPRTSVLNWNTYHLFAHGRHVAAATDFLRETAPDLVALQEVRSCDHARLAELAAGWGHPFVAMHKESGFPVALTSSAPIEVVERRVDGFHHGYLHARTHGFDVLVVHFWPGKVHEAEHVAERAQRLRDDGRPVLVVGDFNAEIRLDDDYLRAHGRLGEVVDGERRFDYRITDAFLARGFVDLTHRHRPDAHYTFGSPALIPKWRADMDDVRATRRRIDFVFADAATAATSRDARVITDDDTVGRWSDHYPVWVTLAPAQR
ncbi:MAG: endonuclease/exonuclease/phosphatase family protein [Planctomycetes bacterium]|nr:endonuclease/exonuclease/phosphatase family protein [Planctomycetota bacterium]